MSSLIKISSKIKINKTNYLNKRFLTGINIFGHTQGIINKISLTIPLWRSNITSRFSLVIVYYGVVGGGKVSLLLTFELN